MYNLVYINTHDTGRMIAPYGYDVPTPTLTKLAEEGTLFTHAYCCGPTCSPSRAAMLTGTYPHQNGMLGLAQRGFSLDKPERHLASWLGDHGFQTAISGIQHETGWYLDPNEEAIQRLGYQQVLTAPSQGYKKEELCLWDRENAKRAAHWLDCLEPGKPFLLTFGLHSTHRPYPEEIAASIDPRYVRPPFPGESNDVTRRDQAQFMTTAQWADENIRLLLDALENAGLRENTIVLFTTDHGVALPFHKCSLTDEGIGVSLILRHPKDGHGVVNDQLISQVDLFPTICDLLGLQHPDYLEGYSFAPSLKDPTAKARTEIFAEINFHTSYEPARCIRDRRYKYIRYYDEKWNRLNLSNMDESGPKSLLLDNGLAERTKPQEALYDCFFDPEEVCNILDHPEAQEVLCRLKSRLQEHLEQTNDPILRGPLEILPHYKVNQPFCKQASSPNPDDYDHRGRC